MLKKKNLLVLALVLCSGFVEAQQLNERFFNCERLEYRNSSGRLVDLTNTFSSAHHIINDGVMVLMINFNDGSLPLLFYFSVDSHTRLPDGTEMFTDVEQMNPETFETISTGLNGGYNFDKQSGKLIYLVRRGAVTYLSLVIPV